MTYTILQATYRGNNNSYYCIVDETMHGTNWQSELSEIFTANYRKLDVTNLDSWIVVLNANHYTTTILATTSDISSLPQSHPELFI